MNLAKAKELNKEVEKSLQDGKRFYHANAVKLGIEALQRELDNRSGSKYVIVAPLAGETKE